METWRIVQTPHLPGSFNMAIDQTIANFVSEGRVRSTLRFFSWRPFCLSLGYHQSTEDVDFPACRKNGVDVVRRPTGGKAVFHAAEFTYSVIADASSCVFGDSIAATFHLLAGWLTAGLADLGVAAEVSPVQNVTVKQDIFKNPSCFSSTSDYEISVQGKKLIGSAQRRRQNVMLQHGSLLSGTLYLNVAGLLHQSAQKRRNMREYLAAHTICLKQLIAPVPDFETIAAALTYAWREKIKVAKVQADLSGEEWLQAKKLQPEFEVKAAKRAQWHHPGK